jgi:hypothetical protein
VEETLNITSDFCPATGVKRFFSLHNLQNLGQFACRTSRPYLLELYLNCRGDVEGPEGIGPRKIQGKRYV